MPEAVYDVSNLSSKLLGPLTRSKAYYLCRIGSLCCGDLISLVVSDPKEDHITTFIPRHLDPDCYS